jgi:2-dehydropantoate 2-reductase
MKVLVYGAGVIGSLLAARLHEAGHDVSLLARGERLATLRENGVLLAEAGSRTIMQVPVPVVERPAGPYDLITILVRTHQVDAALESIIGHDGDVLFMLNWAAGPEPLGAVIGERRVLLGFPTIAGNMDGEVVRCRATSLLTQMVSMPIGEPSGIVTPRLGRIVQTFRSAGMNAKAEPRIDAWLKTHAAFEVPLGQAVHAAGGLEALAGDTHAIRNMIRLMRNNFATMPTGPVPRVFNALRIIPEGVLVTLFAWFLLSQAAAPLATDSPAVAAELERMAEQLCALTGGH